MEKHQAQLKERALSSYKTFNRKSAAYSLTSTTERQRPSVKRNPGQCMFTEQSMWPFFKQNTTMKQYFYVVFSDNLGVVFIDEVVPIPLDSLGRPH